MLSANEHGSRAPTPGSSSTAAATKKKSESPTESRKRKRCRNAPAAWAQKSITIRACPTLPHDRAITLTPVKLVERSQVPLSFLDVTGFSSSPVAVTTAAAAVAATFPSTRLFSAHIEVLEHDSAFSSPNGTEDDDDDDAPPPKVLIARADDAAGSLHVVERVRRGVHALCRLGSWVRPDDIGAVPPPPAPPPQQYARPLKAARGSDGAHWWRRAAVQLSPSPSSAAAADGSLGHGDGSGRPRVDMRVRGAVLAGEPMQQQSQHHQPRRPDGEGADPSVNLEEADEAAAVPAADGGAGGFGEERAQTAEEVFHTVVQQYLEALYVTKTSLAFFVKGPMSRARAAFTLGGEGAGLKMGDLAVFLRSILLQPGPMDKKHREKVPEIVKAMPLPGLSDDDDDEAKAAKAEKKKKKSRSKKLKPNKEGLYPGEDEHVRRWWLQDRPGHSPHGNSESPADVLKRRLGDLRIRESMAQVILVLEIMALEASPSFQATEQDETQQDDTQAESQAAPVKRRKPKKLQDLNVLLDLLLDRLCIWQSVEQDETLIKSPKSSSAQSNALTLGSGKPGPSDKLRNFCVEVVLPFYMSRLPEKAAAINKRLGGPSASPAKPPGPGSGAQRNKPGEAAVRVDPRTAQQLKKRRPLARVATENAGHHPPRHPSLTRSSTDPLLLPPSLKREGGGDTPSLSSIPLQPHKESRKPATSSSRNSLSQFERFSRRTIDLDAMSKSNEAKLRKKAHVERELERAIGTLRKPNRDAALKDAADSADSRRQLLTAAAARKTKSGGGGSSSSSINNTILVGATPKRGRKTKDVLQATPNHNRFATSITAADDDDGHDVHANRTLRLLSMASDPVIPSSAVRPGPVDRGASSSAFAIPASAIKGSSYSSSASAATARASHGVEETPSRGPAGKTVHWFAELPRSPSLGTSSASGRSRGATRDRGAGAASATVEATPRSKTGGSGVSSLGEKLKASSTSASLSAVGGDADFAHGAGDGGFLGVPPPPQPPPLSSSSSPFKLPGKPFSAIMRASQARRGEVEDSEGSEDEYGGLSALMRTPTKSRRGQVLETPVKRAGAAIGETPAKPNTAAVGESKGKEKVADTAGLDGRMDEEDEIGDSIYNALGWDDDIDELA